MRTVMFESTVSLTDGSDLDVDVEADVYAWRPGRFTGHPDTWYPDEPADAEIVSVSVDGSPVHVGHATKDRLCEEAIEFASILERCDW